jgi:phosphoserine phosphatase
MQLQASALEERTDRLVDRVVELLKRVAQSLSAKKVTKTLLTDATAMKSGYREACASSSPEQFIERIALVAGRRHV